MSETPRESADASAFDGMPATPEDREQHDSMSMDLLDTPGGDGSTDEALGLDGGGDGGTMLMPHERKLPISEQRRIVAARKQHGDGIDEDENQAMGLGKRGRGRRRPHADGLHEHGSHGGGQRERRGPGQRQAHGGGPLRPEGDAESGNGTGGGNARGPVDQEEAAATGSGSGGSHIERDASVQDGAVATPAVAVAAASATTAPIDSATRLDDPSHPHAPLYDAALKAVAELAPSQAAMGPTEQANVAAALTARMAGDAAFAPQVDDPSRLSFGLGQNGDRLFAINHPVPDAPNAVHVSVNLEQARAQSIEASSGHVVDAATATRDPVHEQAVETQAREHAPRMA